MTFVELLPPLAWSLQGALWIAIWSGLAASGVLLVVLWRTKLRSAAPWKKCAVISLWVHVLLACVATTIRIFSHGGPGLGDGDGFGPPMRVAIVSEQPEGDAEAAEPEAPAWEEPVAPPLAAPQPPPLPEERPKVAAPEPEVAEAAPTTAPQEFHDAAPPLDAPNLLAEIEPPAAKPAPLEKKDDVVVDAAPAEHDDAPPPLLATAPRAVKKQSGDGDAKSSTRKTSTRPANLSSDYADRFAENRNQLVAGRGGNEKTESAVRAALAWLASAQSADGRWEPARYGAGQERYVLGQDRGGAGAKAETGISGLALLALMGAGHTHQDGEYAPNVARGLEFLKRSQRTDGNLGGDAELFARMYCHSMAMFALSEAYAVTHDPALSEAVARGAAYSLAVQHPTDGGWRYRPGDTGDTSQLGWQVMALKSAQLGGVDVPDATWTRVSRFLRNVERGSAGGLAAYRPEGPPTRTMTAEALYCRQLLAERLGGVVDDAATTEAVRSLLDQPPSNELVNMYYWYYATLALHQAQHRSPASEAAWDNWNRALVRTLVASQRKDGSWPEACVWGGYGGQIYSTALATMCLEVYYRYAPGEASESGVARREGWQAVPQR